jgi:hypothetical protein
MHVKLTLVAAAIIISSATAIGGVPAQAQCQVRASVCTGFVTTVISVPAFVSE